MTDYELSLPEGLELKMVGDVLTLTDGELSLSGDFTTMLPRLKHNNLTHELLVKASKLKQTEGLPYAIDATAGMGEDSLLLAAAGFQVRMYEQDPVIAALLADTLRRSALIPELSAIVARMELVHGDSIEGIRGLERTPDIIYLDPMFPERNKTGLIKKKFQLLQKLERPCSEGAAEELLSAAIAANPRRIVIKRPQKGPYLADRKPSYSLEGKAIRYDCVVIRTV